MEPPAFLKFFFLFFLLPATTAVQAEEPIRLPAPGGEVVIPSAADKQVAYDQYHHAPARRVGDTLYVSGVVAGRRKGEGNDLAAYQEQVRRAFRRLEAILTAAGADFGDVVMLNTFHDWQAAPFNGDRPAQFAAFGVIKDEFMKEPYPAWTAVGTSALIFDGGMVVIQAMCICVPRPMLLHRERPTRLPTDLRRVHA